MLTVYREGKNVIARIDYDVEWSSNFKSEKSTECHAELCVQSFNRKIKSTLKKIREEAYNKGWKHKSDKKRSKETWFSGSF